MSQENQKRLGEGNSLKIYESKATDYTLAFDPFEEDGDGSTSVFKTEDGVVAVYKSVNKNEEAVKKQRPIPKRFNGRKIAKLKKQILERLSRFEEMPFEVYYEYECKASNEKTYVLHKYRNKPPDTIQDATKCMGEVMVQTRVISVLPSDVECNLAWTVPTQSEVLQMRKENQDYFFRQGLFLRPIETKTDADPAV